MKLRIYSPRAPGIRFKRRVFWERAAFKIKRLSLRVNSRFRINNKGRMVINSKGRGCQTRCFNVDWVKLYDLLLCTFPAIYAKQHNAGLCLSQFFNNSFVYYNNNLKLDRLNNFFFLPDIKLGSKISNLEIHPEHGIQYIRSAGTCGILMREVTSGVYLIKLPSKKKAYSIFRCRASLGPNNNKYHKYEIYSKAGTTRKLGKKIHVCGTSMNANEHPQGGESGPSRSLKSPWGWVIK